jgi:tetratricopeptide (TPR) repeat protein
MTSAATSGGTALPPSDIYLPVSDAQLAHPFDKSQVLEPSLVAKFRERVPVDVRAQFDAGVRALGASSYGDAERSFKQAVSPEEDSSAVLAYVAATFAATGHDVDAAGAWQSSLITSDESPEVYEWLAAALMRSRNLAQARSTLEEAVAKWPADARFAKPLALLYATFGQGQQAVRMLERHLAAHPDDADGMMLGVEWLYQLALAGTTAHSRSEDLRLARRYADAYLETRGERAALVRQWMEFLEKRR